MISFSAVWAITLRHAYLLRRDINLLLAGFYWPLLDIVIWGFLGSWIASDAVSSQGLHNYKLVALLGVLLWQIVGRNCNYMLICLVEEIWASNVVNLFSLPVRLAEWILGILLFCTTMLWVVTFFCMGCIALFHDISMYDLIIPYLIFFPPLFFSSIWVGFICLQIIVMLGKRGFETGWVVIWFLLPFSGAYYPVEVLPQWGQTLSAFLPMSYAFSGMRAYVMHQQDPTSYLIIAYALSIVYAICSMCMFVYCFNRSKQKGLARLTD